MKKIIKRKSIIRIILAGIWITFSEFLRNEILFKDYWITKYESLGLNFETLPINSIFWMIWSFTLAGIIFYLLQKLNRKETFLITWIISFPMMWVTLFNLQVLPIDLLIFAIPLSALEIFVSINLMYNC